MRKSLVAVLTAGLLLPMSVPVLAAQDSLANPSLVLPLGTPVNESLLEEVAGEYGPVKLSDGGPGGGIVYPLNPDFLDTMFTSVGKAATTVAKGAMRVAKAIDTFLDKTVGKVAKYFGYYELYRRLRGGDDR